eukprot:CAMPEP_0169287730 /NCGR_PEP_ID=MMETSP1016-20121227/60107_1 /TAXON_ID=342587 /ORGANISM="Karlodinium micrum, Strain CCMP2283" /LENGTH=57 /DNA_ID=CAMNT_0009377763 /DNA_START=1 /DNA_END=170 /DNA_ORIENTATION=+
MAIFWPESSRSALPSEGTSNGLNNYGSTGGAYGEVDAAAELQTRLVLALEKGLSEIA